MECRKSLFKQGAEWGVPFGIYLSVMALLFIFSDKQVGLSAFSLAMALVIPALIYRWQKKRCMAEMGFATFSNLWMLGILIFIGGSLIASTVSYLVLEYVRPNFFYEQAQFVIHQYEVAPERFGENMQQVVDALQMVIDKQAAPRNIDLVLTGFWTCSFLGSLLSALLAALIQLMAKNKK
ncbi:MAG: DUF4199 domain-containing protein [Sodaliphilus sp.]